MLGSAIVRGHATEIIDVGHFLPLAFEDWFRRREQPAQNRASTVLLVDDSLFYLNMLTPVLRPRATLSPRWIRRSKRWGS